MSTEYYDIVVVGGGPAGSMAARAASELGAKTLVLERDSSIGIPVRCGEGVSVRNVRRFVEVKPQMVAANIGGLIVYAPDETAVPIAMQGEIGVVLERTVFDRYLAETAAAAGANIQTRCDVTGLITSEKVVRGVYYTRLGKRFQIKCGVVIACDGVESRVGRWAGIRTQLAASDLESAYQKVLTNIDYDHENCHFYVGNELAPGGYLWIFPKGERTASVGIGVEVGRCSAGDAYRKLDGFIHRHFGNPSVVGEMAGGVPCAQPLKKPFADGIILAGDAARHCNPLTGGGIYTAMVSGYHAGQVAVESAGKGDTSAEALKAFNNRIKNAIIKTHKRSYRLAKAVVKLTDDEMNKTAREIMSIPPEERTMRTIFLKGLVAFPKLTVDVLRAFM